MAAILIKSGLQNNQYYMKYQILEHFKLEMTLLTILRLSA